VGADEERGTDEVHRASLFDAAGGGRGGALLGGLGGVYIAGSWAEGMIFGGMGGAVFGMLYDPRAATYTVPTRGGAEYPGNRDDYRP
jgi:hypothetical protein